MQPGVAGQLITGEGAVLIDDMFHLRFDAAEVVGGDGSFEGDVVVEPVLQRRAVGELSLRPEAEDRLGHDVGTRVAEQIERIGVDRFAAAVGLVGAGGG